MLVFSFVLSYFKSNNHQKLFTCPIFIRCHRPIRIGYLSMPSLQRTASSQNMARRERIWPTNWSGNAKWMDFDQNQRWVSANLHSKLILLNVSKIYRLSQIPCFFFSGCCPSLRQMPSHRARPPRWSMARSYLGDVRRRPPLGNGKEASTTFCPEASPPRSRPRSTGYATTGSTAALFRFTCQRKPGSGMSVRITWLASCFFPVSIVWLRSWLAFQL